VTVSYLDFVAALGIGLSPAQREFAAVAFDGQPPSDTAEGHHLWGPDLVGVVAPPAARKVAAAVCGRASGKSLLGGTRLLQLAMTVDVSGLQPREIAVCPVIAPDLDTAQQVVRFALGAAEALQLKIVNRVADGEQEFSIIRANEKRVRIVARAASAGGISARGRSMPGAVLDEAAFFRDASHKINDQDIYDALKHRIMPGGQIVLLSTPWLEAGLLYQLWVRNFGNPVDALVAHAPTSLMRSDVPSILADIELERTVDPEKCARERDAEFMSSNAAAFFNPRAIAAALTDKDVERVEGSTRAVGGDFAFRRNSTAFVAVQTYADENGKRIYEVTDLLEKQPRGEPLKPSAICAEGARFAHESGVDEIIADGHYREAVAEHLLNHGVTHIIAPEGASGKADTFQTTRNLFHEDAIRLPRNHPLTAKLLRQLREVTSRALAGGGVSIESPLWRTGEHGDLVSALTLAIWRAFKLGWVAPEKDAATSAGMDELERRCMHEAQDREERLQRYRRVTGLKR
jgi:hypothetical protein